MKTKQKIIQESYGEHWEEVKDYVNNDGWCLMYYFPLNIKSTHKVINNKHYLRPISLKGIENNNGWIKIESEADLPTLGYYEVIRRDTGESFRTTLDNDFGSKIAIEMYSHWKKIEDIKLPLF